MRDAYIKLNTFTDIKEVVNIVSKYEFDIDGGHNKYIIDMKSIMALLSLSLADPIYVRPITDDNVMIDKLFEELQPWTV